MTFATNLGFPRIGVDRQLKRTLEKFWKGEATEADLLTTGRNLRMAHWNQQKLAGLDLIPCNDFSLYDQMLDMAALLGAVPARYGWKGETVDLPTYFAMARGNAKAPAMEMTKWFDTNYHYIVPELSAQQNFRLATTKVFEETTECQSVVGIDAARPVLIGPVTFLSLSKMTDGGDPLDLLPRLLPAYVEILKRLGKMGVEWVQLDEPILATDLRESQRKALKTACETFTHDAPEIKLLLTSYFGPLGNNTDLVLDLPVDGLHLDLVRGAGQLDSILPRLPSGIVLSCGVVNGRNIWRTDLRRALAPVEQAIAALGQERVWVAPSCSLLHSPVDLDMEVGMDSEIKSWLAFAKQKLAEIATLSRGATAGEPAIAKTLEESDKVVKSRATSARIHNAAVGARMKALTPGMLERGSTYPQRRKAQEEAFHLPAYPTTTIGSFPQTSDIREARAAWKSKRIDTPAYEARMKAEIASVVKFQEDIGIDVLVHGEAERNDMVEYFGEQLSGFAFTSNGWVQSYGSRCVKPPIIYGDVARPAPMTVDWSRYAQSLTSKPMKGMLTGPVTILQWSFVRDDQPRADTCRQIGLALRDEVLDLERAGITIIQIDEPALREGLPLRKGDQAAYLQWAVDSFRLSAAGVQDSTQIHTHMCYAEFNDIIEAVAALDADVVSIETSRSRMELLGAFAAYKYPNEIGPGVYDIHSPRIPSVEEMVALLQKARAVLRGDQIWVNPDCGLKTRGWAEVKPALTAMVQAAREMRHGGAAQAA